MKVSPRSENELSFEGPSDKINPGKAPCGSKIHLERKENRSPKYLPCGVSAVLRAHME